jgi:putative methyltransferase (TIGR04325 family)
MDVIGKKILNNLKQAFKNSIPSPLKNLYRKFFSPPKKYGWFGNYTNWKDAEKECSGYDSETILEKVKESVLKVKSGEAVYERDSVLFDEIQYSEPLLNAFKSIAKKNDNTLHIVDFGGSLGSSYFQNRNFLKELKELKWSIVEQKHFVDCGKEFFEDEHLKFYYTIDEALNRAESKVLLLSSVIQYFEKPYELIEKCINYNFDYIIIDRTGFIDKKKDRITVQIVPEYIYKASYAAWFFNEQKFINSFTDKYDIVDDFVSELSKPMNIDKNTKAYWKGFLLKKIK